MNILETDWPLTFQRDICLAIFDIFAQKLSDLSCSHEKPRSKSLFVNSVNVYYTQVKVSQKMEESMAIFAVNVSSSVHIQQKPGRVVIMQI